MKNAILALVVLASSCCSLILRAQTAPAHPTETIVVLGTAAPAPLAESMASLVVEPVEPALLAVGNEQDLLRRDSSILLATRGSGGGQADLSLRGGSFGQTLVLLNGFRVNDGQTGHHNLDLPLPLEAMSQIEVLHGAGSTLHGEDALAGVVDFLTAAPAATGLHVRSGFGSFNSFEDSAQASLLRQRWSARLTAERNSSDGFMADRDYRNELAALESWIGSRLGVTDVLLAASDRAFGANGFYGAALSWERTKSWFAAVRQDLGAHTQAAFAYRRHTDLFDWLRANPSAYENNHATGAWQASLRHRSTVVSSSSALLFGLEADGDSIRSFHAAGGAVTDALGVHAENRGAGYVALDLRPAKRRWSFSAGAREAILSGGVRTVFSPHLAASYRLADSLKARASAGYGYRLPSYTDRYYKGVGTQGNADLKPESAWSGEGGLDWTPAQSLHLSATGFYSRQHDTIDYVKAATLPNPYLPADCPANVWCAANLNELRLAGAEFSAEWRPSQSHTVRAAWTGVAGQQTSLDGAQSKYALNYPDSNFSCSWTANMGQLLTATNSVRVVKIHQQPGVVWNAAPYALWDAALAHDTGKIRPYLRLENLANTGYQEISGVAMPGRAITGGVVLALGR
jgi:outer membrane cobalamin receptor